MNKYAWLYYFLVLICMQLFSGHVIGQTEYQLKIDSLQKEIESKPEVEAASDQLELALLQMVTDRDSALKLALKALETAKEKRAEKLLVRAYYVMGRVFIEHENYRKSQSYLDTALSYANLTKDDWNRGEILYRLAEPDRQKFARPYKWCY